MPNNKQVFILPGKHPICQIDGKPINPADEPGGALYLVGGYPMCAVHRLLKRQVKGKLDYRKVFASRKEADKAILDSIVAKEISTQKENQRIMEVAAESQEEAAKIDKRTQLTST